MLLLVIASLSLDLDSTGYFEKTLSRPGTIPHVLYSLARLPSGYSVCDKSIRMKQLKRFNKLYASRFSRLSSYISREDGLGWDPGDVVVSSCINIKHKDAKNRMRALESQFVEDIKSLELKYVPRSEL